MTLFLELATLMTNVLIIGVFILMIITSWIDIRTNRVASRKLEEADLALRGAERLLREARAERLKK